MRIQLTQPAAAELVASVAPRLLTDEKLIAHFRALGTPLPFGLTRLRQDRLRGVLGGIPHRRFAGKCLYDPCEVGRFLFGLPIIQPKPSKAAKHTGKQSVVEKVCVGGGQKS